MTNIPILDLQTQYQAIKNEMDRAVLDVMASGWFVLGPNVKALEKEVAEYAGCQYGIGVASGTDALRLSYAALDIGPGHEVITTPFTFVATANTISHAGARPVFVDIDSHTFNLVPEQVEAAITERTRDDFGKGYSSIDLLSQLPFSCIKLDRDMVRRIGTSSKVEHIVESVCSLARKLGMKLIAEGVESHYAYNELSRHGCDHAQGFWISHPLPLNEYIDFARHSPSWGIGLAASGEGDAKWETSYCLPCCS